MHVQCFVFKEYCHSHSLNVTYMNKLRLWNAKSARTNFGVNIQTKLKLDPTFYPLYETSHGLISEWPTCKYSQTSCYKITNEYSSHILQWFPMYPSWQPLWHTPLIWSHGSLCIQCLLHRSLQSNPKYPVKHSI